MATKTSKNNQFASYDRQRVEAVLLTRGQEYTAGKDLAATRDAIARLESLETHHLTKDGLADLKRDIRKYRDWAETLVRLFPEIK